MKVALVIYQFDEPKGGVEAYAANFSRQLIAHGHELHVFCAKKGAAPDGITFHDVPVTKFWSPLAVRSFARNSARILQQETFDIIHGFSRTYYQDIYRIGGGCHAEYLRQTYPWASTPLGRAFIALNPRHRAIIALEKMRYDRRNYRRLTAISELTKREIVREFNVPPEDITVIYNAVDAARFAPERLTPLRPKTREKLGLAANETAILFVGTGWQRKGLRHLIAAMPLLGDAKAKLIVVGEGDIPAFRQIAANAGAAPRVVFAGHSSRVEEYYAAADIFAFPSLHDAFGTAVLEAMASGLPVACSKLAGASEIITDGADSLLVEDPRDAAALASRIKILLNPEKRRKIGEEARLTARKHSYEENYRRTMQVYDEVLRMKKSGGQ
jgi:UDP-glucose:(heptosyl)LPS alpha-1,3-glucosyltransferase